MQEFEHIRFDSCRFFSTFDGAKESDEEKCGIVHKLIKPIEVANTFQCSLTFQNWFKRFYFNYFKNSIKFALR